MKYMIVDFYFGNGFWKLVVLLVCKTETVSENQVIRKGIYTIKSDNKGK